MSQAPDDDDDDLDGDEDEDLDDDDDLDDDETDDADLEHRAPGGSEGVFNERRNVFSSKERADERMDHRNAGPISRDAEARQVYDIVKTKDDDAPVVTKPSVQESPVAAPPQGPVKKALVARYDKNGNPKVAWFHDKEQKEAFRTPTKAEVDLLVKKGKVTSGGIAAVDEPASGGIPWKKVAIGAVVVAAVGGVGYWLYKRSQDDYDEADG